MTDQNLPLEELVDAAEQKTSDENFKKYWPVRV